MGICQIFWDTIVGMFTEWALGRIVHATYLTARLAQAHGRRSQAWHVVRVHAEGEGPMGRLVL